MKTDVLIIGAGPAGMTLAADLGERGVSSVMVERAPFPGGHAALLACKALDRCAKCNACLLEDAAASLAAQAGWTLLAETRVETVARADQGYLVRLEAGPRVLDPERCVDCGLCLDACPEQGRAIRVNPVPGVGPRYAFDPQHCLRTRGEACSACFDACPVGAVDFDARPGQVDIEARAVAPATGPLTPFDPALKPRFGHSRLPDVITGLELEAMIRETGETLRPSNRAAPGRVAFIQCVGSRDRSLNRDYCSRICCGYALRLARLIRSRRPETAVSVFYMDIQNFGRGFEETFIHIQNEVELIHGIPGEITADDRGSVRVPFLNEDSGRGEEREFDLVVLSIGLGGPDQTLDDPLGLQRNEDGFLISAPDQGLFVTGAAGAPLSVAEACAQARAMAADVVAWLESQARGSA